MCIYDSRHTKFPVGSSNGSLVIAIKPKPKYVFCASGNVSKRQTWNFCRVVVAADRLTAIQCGETHRWTHGHTTWLISFLRKKKAPHKSFTFFRTRLTSHMYTPYPDSTIYELWIPSDLLFEV